MTFRKIVIQAAGAARVVEQVAKGEAEAVSSVEGGSRRSTVNVAIHLPQGHIHVQHQRR
jgi:hypothetical protein